MSQLRSELLAVEKEGKGQSEVVAELRKQQQGLEALQMALGKLNFLIF